MSIEQRGNGEILSNPKAVYDGIKSRHLVFGESRDEKEMRVDSEHALLMKGKLSGHQFEPLFEASSAERESVGLGQTPRELYLNYLRKMPAVLQKEIRSDKRLWSTDEKEAGGSATLRGPKSWEEATHTASANSVFTYDQDPPNSAAAEARKELDKLKAEANKQAKANATAAANAAEQQSLLALQDKGAAKGRKICFHFRGHGSCPKGKDCPYSHDKELRKQALVDRSNAGGNTSYAATSVAGPKAAVGQGQSRGRPERRWQGHRWEAQDLPLLCQVRRGPTTIWFTHCQCRPRLKAPCRQTGPRPRAPRAVNPSASQGHAVHALPLQEGHSQLWEAHVLG